MQGNFTGFNVGTGGYSTGGPAVGIPQFQQFDAFSAPASPFYSQNIWNTPQASPSSSLDIVKDAAELAGNANTILNLPSKISNIGKTVSSVGSEIGGVLDGTTSVGDALSSVFGSGNAPAQGFTGFTGIDTSPVSNFTSSLGDFGTGVSGNSAGSPFLGQTSTLGQALSGAGFGAFAGGYLGKLFGGSAQGGQIGGALGGALGSVALGGLSTGLGAGLGALGSVVPGVGTVIGTLAGSLLGSAFGGGTPHPWSLYRNATIGKDGTINTPQVTNKHIGKAYGEQTLDSFQKYLQDQSKKYGITYNEGFSTWGGYRDKKGHISLIEDPKYWEGYKGGPWKKTDKETKFTFDANDKKAQQKAYQDAFNFLATKSGYDVANLKPVNTGPVFGGQQQNTESPFDKFLKEYRAKQNANQA